MSNPKTGYDQSDYDLILPFYLSQFFKIKGLFTFISIFYPFTFYLITFSKFTFLFFFGSFFLGGFFCLRFRRQEREVFSRRLTREEKGAVNKSEATFYSASENKDPRVRKFSFANRQT